MKFTWTLMLLSALVALPACGDDEPADDDSTAGPTTDPKTSGATDMTTDAMTTDAMTTDAMTTDAMTTEPTTGEMTTAGALSFAADVWDPIFSPNCSCHQSGSQGSFMMGTDAAAAFTAIINVPSVNSPLMYVVPGESANSYIFHKVNNTHIDAGGAGLRMPFGGMLSEDEIATVKDWIDGGANP